MRIQLGLTVNDAIALNPGFRTSALLPTVEQEKKLQELKAKVTAKEKKLAALREQVKDDFAQWLLSKPRSSRGHEAPSFTPPSDQSLLTSTATNEVHGKGG